MKKMQQRSCTRAAYGGVNFIDTADVYSDGESEKAVGRFLKKEKKREFSCGYQMRTTDSNRM